MQCNVAIRSWIAIRFAFVFLQERHQARQDNKPVGETVLYFGCRNQAVDYIYGEELEMYKNAGANWLY